MAPKKKPVAAEATSDGTTGRAGKRKTSDSDFGGRGKRTARPNRRYEDEFESMEDTEGLEDEHEVDQQHEEYTEHEQQHDPHAQATQQEGLAPQEPLQADAAAAAADAAAQAVAEHQAAAAAAQQAAAGEGDLIAMQYAQQHAQYAQQHALALQAQAHLLAQQQQQQQQQQLMQVVMPNNPADVARNTLDHCKKADVDQVARAKRAGNLVTLHLNLDLPPELQTPETIGRSGLIEVPGTGDVQLLKRLLMYSTNMQLVPTLQQLYAESLDGSGSLVLMADEHIDEEGKKSPMPLSVYGIKDGSAVTLKIVIPDDPATIPLVDDAMSSAAYAAATSSTAPNRTPSRKQRWTSEQIEALVEGVEKNGLSAWRAIVSDPRLVGKNNMQCKDKFRNLCLTIIQGRPERGLTLSWPLKERLRAFIDREHITF